MPLPSDPESDPLAAFDAEAAAARDDSPQPQADQPPNPVEAALDDIAVLKSQVATLVAAVDDIKKRLSPAGLRPRLLVRPAAAGVAALAAAILWALAAPAPTVPQAPEASEALKAPEALTAPKAPKTYVGTLTIDALPAGDVFINREPAGRTPLRVPNLRAGSHLVWIERDGYRRWTRVVPVSADRVSRVSATLEPETP